MLFSSMKGTICYLSMAVACGCLGCDNGLTVNTSPTLPGAPVYTIHGNAVQLGNGVYAGEDGTVSLLASVTGDLNDDGHDDLGAVLALNSKGSGVFYYLNVFLDDGNGRWYLAGEEFLGDRIKFDFMDIYGEGSISSLTGVAIHPGDYGQLVVAYFTHAREQAFAEQPRLYLTRHWQVDDGKLIRVEDY